MNKKSKFEPSRNEMLSILEKNIQPIAKNETIPVAAASGRVCAEDIYAINSLPNKPVSDCDGIAVRFKDFAEGAPDTSLWQEGKEYCFSNTGVALCEAFDTVIAIEKVEFDQEGKIRLLGCPTRQGEYVGVVGKYVKKGELIASKGEMINPSLIGILLASGIINIKVLAKAKVAFIPTGDELVPVGFEVHLGKNAESNSLMLKAYIEECGCEAIIYPIIPDIAEKIKEAILSAAKVADLVLICAGSSKGSKDFTIDILEGLGEVVVHELGHGPGKHCSLAYAGNVPVIGLPGPPNGADLVSLFYINNTLRLMQMQPFQLPYTIQAVLAEDINGYAIDFIGYMRVFMKDGQCYVRPVSMFGKTRAELYHAHNAYFYIRKNSVIKKGESINIEMRCPKEYITEE